jgi:hypothetical protein
MKKLLTLLLLALTLGTASAQTSLDREMREAVDRVKKTLPRQIDSMTFLVDAVYRAPTTAVYTYMTHASKEQLQVIRADVQKISAEYLCSNYFIYSTLMRGATYRYVYLDRDGNLALTINTTKKSCGEIL